jgi:hypothetical protein
MESKFKNPVPGEREGGLQPAEEGGGRRATTTTFPVLGNLLGTPR